MAGSILHARNTQVLAHLSVAPIAVLWSMIAIVRLFIVATVAKQVRWELWVFAGFDAGQLVAAITFNLI